MALTKVTGQVIKTTTDVTVGVLTVTNTLAVGGTVSIGGTLTYEDVTNIDSVGLITARNGIIVGSGITLSKDGDGFFTGVVTATSYYGDGSNLSNITSTTINNNGNDRIITGSNTANTLEGESSLQFDGTDLFMPNDLTHYGDTDTKFGFPSANTISFETGGSERARIDSSGNFLVRTTTLNNSSVDGQALQIHGTTRPTLIFRGNADNNQVAEIQFADNSGSDDSNTGVRAGLIQYSHASNFMAFRTAAAERLRIASNGRVNIGDRTTTPDELLHVHTASGEANILLEGATNSILKLKSHSGDSTIVFSDGSASNVGNLNYDHGSDSFSIRGNSETRLTINSSGQVLINTTDGSGAYQLVIANPTNSDTGLSFKGGASSQQRIRFADGTSGGAERAGQIEYDHSNNEMTWSTSATENMKLDGNGNLTITNGNLAVSGNGPTSTAVCFKARRTGGDSSATPFIFDNEYFDVGSDYNHSTGIFTAPTAGFYQFNIQMTSTTQSGNRQIFLQSSTNGSTWTEEAVALTGFGNAESVNMMIVTTVQTSQTNVQFRVAVSSGDTFRGTNTYAIWSGFRL